MQTKKQQVVIKKLPSIFGKEKRWKITDNISSIVVICTKHIPRKTLKDFFVDLKIKTKSRLPKEIFVVYCPNLA